MRVRCPNCSHPIELVDDVDLESLSCPSCGSSFHLSGSDEDTITPMLSGQVEALQCFVLLEPIGAGQFGRVWRARDTELDRIVALKVPHRQSMGPDDAAIVVREARAAAQLNHPHIVRVYEVGRHDDVVYIVSEYIEGVPLSQWRRHYQPDQRESARLCAQIALALQHAHSRKVVHRDLKPGNIIMDARREPHVTDFGLAKREGADITIAVTGQILGTPAYMAPEQVRDSHAVDRRSDIYALGVVLYELLAGKRPFSGGRRLLLQQVLHDEPPSIRSSNKRISKDLATICYKAMAKRPEHRYESAAEMAEDLERFLDGQPIRARPISTLQRAVRWTKRRPAAATSVALAVVVVILAAALVWLPPRPAPPAGDVRQVALTTLPAGAEVLLVPLDERTGMPLPEQSLDAGKSPVTIECQPGDYLVVAHQNDDLFHEVYRHVPADHEKLPGIYPHNSWEQKGDRFVLPQIRLFSTRQVAQDMVLVTGSTFTIPTSDLAGPTEVTVPDYYIDATETTAGQLRQAALDLPLRMNGEETEPDTPVHGLSWHDAVCFAERLGKRLQRDELFQYVSTRGGSSMGSEGWQVIDETVPGPVRSETFDRLEWDALSAAVIGMRSNVLEWTVNRFAGAGPGFSGRTVRGGYRLLEDGSNSSLAVDKPPPRYINGAGQIDRQAGMRCMRSTQPSLRPDQFIQLRVK